MNPQVFLILLDNIFAGIAAFIAITVWVKTRDISWIFIVLSVIGFYVSIIYKTLVFFGIVFSEKYSIAGVNVLDMIFNYIPLILMIVALALKAVRNMKR